MLAHALPLPLFWGLVSPLLMAEALDRGTRRLYRLGREAEPPGEYSLKKPRNEESLSSGALDVFLA